MPRQDARLHTQLSSSRNPSTSSSRRRPGPITTACDCEWDCGRSVTQQRAFGVMGPGLRRDDTENVAGPVALAARCVRGLPPSSPQAKKAAPPRQPPAQPRRFFFGFLPNFGFAATSGHCAGPAWPGLPRCFFFLPNLGSSPDVGLAPFSFRSDRNGALESRLGALSSRDLPSASRENALVSRSGLPRRLAASSLRGAPCPPSS